MKMLYRQAGENINKLLSKVKTPDDGYKALGFAIVVEAAEDYRRARAYGDKYAMQSIERFLRSWLCYLFSGGVDGDYIISKLRKETIKR